MKITLIFGSVMDQIATKTVLPALIFLAGWVLTGSFFAGVLLAVVALFMAPLIQGQMGGQTGTGFNENQDFTHIVLLLSAAVIKADGRIYKQERELVRRRLAHDFNPMQVEKYMNDLSVCLKKKIDVNGVCGVVRQNFDYPSKVQLFHFLTGLTVTNGLIVDSEFELLQRIARLIELPERSFRSILAMFSFQRIGSYEQRQSHSKSYSRSSSSELSRAYQILEINASATDDEVKKAYRKLAKVHHPDRVVHLGEEYQKNAKQKFQKIADAYELIKSKRNMK